MSITMSLELIDYRNTPKAPNNVFLSLPTPRAVGDVLFSKMLVARILRVITNSPKKRAC